jgi:hypothetical protein
VRRPACKPAQGFHLLSPVQLVLQALALGYIDSLEEVKALFQHPQRSSG